MLILKTPPSVEPLSSDQAQTALRLDLSLSDVQTSEESYLSSLITAARQDIENLCGPLITQSWYQYLDRWPVGEIIIEKPRLLSVVAVKYTDEDGVVTTFASTNYTVDTKDTLRPRIVLKPDCSWPNATLFHVNPIEIEFTCGYGATSSAVPGPIIQAMLLYVTNRWENRQPTAETERAAEMAIMNLVANYRVWGF